MGEGESGHCGTQQYSLHGILSVISFFFPDPPLQVLQGGGVGEGTKHAIKSASERDRESARKIERQRERAR